MTNYKKSRIIQYKNCTTRVISVRVHTHACTSLTKNGYCNPSSVDTYRVCCHARVRSTVSAPKWAQYRGTIVLLQGQSIRGRPCDGGRTWVAGGLTLHVLKYGRIVHCAACWDDCEVWRICKEGEGGGVLVALKTNYYNSK